MQVPFHRHNLGEAELASLAQTLQSTILTMGPRTEEFEKKFGQYFSPENPPEVVAVTNGTTALYLTLKALGIGRGDEIITTALSFMATANAIYETGATPVFVDVEPGTGLIDVSLIQEKITSRTKAILPVHLYGQMCDMKAICHLAHLHGLRVVEDSCHCIEGHRNKIRPGRISAAACFSFHALKTLASGEGGAIVTHDKRLADKLRLMRYFGITRSLQFRNAQYASQDTETGGLNFKLDDIKAALLIPQIPRLEEHLRRREDIASRYYEELKEAVGFPVIRPDIRSARNLFTVWVDPARRDDIVVALRERGVGCTVQYSPILPHLTVYRRAFPEIGPFPNAEDIASRTIALPFYPSLTDEEIGYVIDTVRDVMK